MKKFFCILLTLLLMVPLVTSVSAVIPGYGLYVGGIEVTAQNAADVLGDGTVSYDAESKTLTLNGANITELHTADIVSAGVYAEIANLTIKLVGENRITVPIEAGDMPDGSEVAVASTENIEISGTGKLWSNTYVVTSMQDIAIKNCEISS
ncbi:MAG: hypothetical protein J6B77_08070, partial [Clostridia bacterium]|nr:hypothetical protein [Clostridia bacterium]